MNPVMRRKQFKKAKPKSSPIINLNSFLKTMNINRKTHKTSIVKSFVIIINTMVDNDVTTNIITDIIKTIIKIDMIIENDNQKKEWLLMK